MKHSKEERIEIYKKAIEVFIGFTKGPYKGFCVVLGELGWGSYGHCPYIYEVDDYFPELKPYRPMWLEDYFSGWFTFDEVGNERRIAILEEVVDKLAKNILLVNVVTFHRIDEDFNEEWFFSTDHCQPGLGDDWVPVTTYNTTKEKQRDRMYPILGGTSKEIPNPNPAYQG